MEKNWETLASEGLWPHELKRLKAAKAGIERQPKPESEKGVFTEWRESQEKLLKAQCEQLGKNIASSAEQRILETFNVDDFKKGAVEIANREVMKILSPFILLEFFPHLEKAMSDIIDRRVTKEWEGRFSSINDRIKRAESEISQHPAFSPDRMNVDPRFPWDRVAQDQGKFVDKWLTQALRAKKPIFFSDENYQGKLIEFYEQIYLPTAKREKEEKLKPESPSEPQKNMEVGEKYSMPFSGQVEFGLLPKSEDDGPRSKLYNPFKK